MDENLKWLVTKRIEKTIENIKKNNMEAYVASNNEEVIKILEKIMKEGEKVAVGGSMTLFETGVIDYLRNGKYEFLDRYREGLTPLEIKNIFRQSFLCDTYLVSSNAITVNGELYNVDGNGNRVAAMLYGPDKVIVIVGYNKIVENIEEAIDRNKYVSGPTNAKRLSVGTPCVKLGKCMDCKSESRICNDYVLIRKQRTKGRIHVIIVEKELGY